MKLATLGDRRLQCSEEELADSLRGSMEATHRQMLRLHLQRLKLLDEQIETLDVTMAQLLKKYEEAVVRVAKIPGFLADGAQQIIAEVGPEAETFPSAGQFCSWVGLRPRSEESAEQNKSSRSPKGNRSVRQILNQAAQAAVKRKGSRFQNLFQRLFLDWEEMEPSGR